jgi:hypothetical protein
VHRKSPLGPSLRLFYQEISVTVPVQANSSANINDEKLDCVMSRQKVQSMSLISVFSGSDAYNAKVATLSSIFGGSDENKQAIQRKALGDRQHS